MRDTEPRKRPTQARSQRTVEAMTEAGARILAREGYGRLTTNRVAELAGVSIGSFYQYFQNKDALVIAIYRHYQAQVRTALGAAFDGRADISDFDGVRRLIAVILKAHQVDPKLHSRFEAMRQDGTLPAALEESELNHVAGHLETLLAHDPDSRLAARIMVTTVSALLHAYERGDLPCDPDRIVDEISCVVFGYLSSRDRH